MKIATPNQSLQGSNSIVRIIVPFEAATCRNFSNSDDRRCRCINAATCNSDSVTIDTCTIPGEYTITN